MIAKLLYRDILSTDGGPILELKHRRVNYFEDAFESYSYLSIDLIADGKSKYGGKIYGRSDGTGYSTNLKKAVYISISEAIERWAFLSCVSSGKYGFSIDSTTNGMAAFPSLLSRYAIEKATLEAYERWCLIEWWNGSIDGELIKDIQPGLNIVLFSYKNWFSCIAFKNFESFRAYGFSGGKTLNAALYKAKIELYRNYELLSNFDFSQDVEDIVDKRILYFAKEGQKMFDERVYDSKSRSAIPKLIVNNEIKGPWTKYAIVWRCLFQHSTSKFLDKDHYFFYF
jgi:hypothetical protein